VNSPLKADQATIKEFGIDKNVDVDDVFKLNFARTQRDEIQKALWRERIDLIVAQYQVAQADDEGIKVQHQSKVAEKKMLIKQFVRSVQVLNELISELENQESN
jgi:hypothetical protein